MERKYRLERALAVTLITASLLLGPAAQAIIPVVPTAPSRVGGQLIGDSEFMPLSHASTLVQKGRNAEALSHLISTVEQNPVNILALFHLGNAYLDLAKQSDLPEQQLIFLEQSLQAFERVNDLNPELTLTYFKLGKVALMKGDVESAKKYYQAGLALDPNNAALIFNLARVYDQSNDKAQAIAFYERTLSVDPNFTYAYNNLGLLYEERSELKNAEKYYKKALSKDKNYTLARLNLGNLYAASGRYEEAKTELITARKQEPTNAWTHYYLGNLHLRMSNYEEAVQSYQEASSLNPNHALTYYLLAVSLSKLKRLDEALQASLHYVQLEPNGEYSREMKSLIMAVKLSQSSGFSLMPTPAAAIPPLR